MNIAQMDLLKRSGKYFGGKTKFNEDSIRNQDISRHTLENIRIIILVCVYVCVLGAMSSQLFYILEDIGHNRWKVLEKV